MIGTLDYLRNAFFASVWSRIQLVGAYIVDVSCYYCSCIRLECFRINSDSFKRTALFGNSVNDASKLIKIGIYFCFSHFILLC